MVRGAERVEDAGQRRNGALRSIAGPGARARRGSGAGSGSTATGSGSEAGSTGSGSTATSAGRRRNSAPTRTPGPGAPGSGSGCGHGLRLGLRLGFGLGGATGSAVSVTLRAPAGRLEAHAAGGQVALPFDDRLRLRAGDADLAELAEMARQRSGVGDLGPELGRRLDEGALGFEVRHRRRASLTRRRVLHVRPMAVWPSPSYDAVRWASEGEGHGCGWGGSGCPRRRSCSPSEPRRRRRPPRSSMTTPPPPRAAPGQVSVFLRAADGDAPVPRTCAATPSRRGATSAASSTSGPGAAGRTSTIRTCSRAAPTARCSIGRSCSAAARTGTPGTGPAATCCPRRRSRVRKGPGYIDTFYRGPDNSINAISWVPGSGLDGRELDPARPRAHAVRPRRGGAHARDTLDVFVRGTYDAVHRNVWNGSAWSGWTLVPGGMTTTQRAGGHHARDRHARAVRPRRRPAGSRWSSFDGVAFSAWKTVPGARRLRGSPPSPTDPTRIYLFARRGGEVVWNLYDRGTGPEEGWRGWQPLHPPPPPPPPPRLRSRRRPRHRPRADRPLRQARRG